MPPKGKSAFSGLACFNLWSIWYSLVVETIDFSSIQRRCVSLNVACSLCSWSPSSGGAQFLSSNLTGIWSRECSVAPSTLYAALPVGAAILRNWWLSFWSIFFLVTLRRKLLPVPPRLPWKKGVIRCHWALKWPFLNADYK